MFVHHSRRARGLVSWLTITILSIVSALLLAVQPSPSAAALDSNLQSEISRQLASVVNPQSVGFPLGTIRNPQLDRPQSSTRIAAENALPGTDEWANLGNYDINSLQAFVGATSVNAGGAINIHVKSTGSSLSARLYRLGYYQDHGARLYATYSGIATPAQPNCTLDNNTGLVSCPWSPTFTVNTDPTWIGGFYLLRLDSDNGFRFFVYFIVRNDGYSSDILVMEPTKTNQAYNRYGGESLYYSDPTHGGSRTRAYQVSFDRPYLGGAGTGSVFTHDIETVRWLEASGYDVSYISDIDRAANPGLLLNHRVFMVEGHDEYWTWSERDAVEAARDSGVNIIFASGNESYWRVRLDSSTVGPNRVITCYKDAALDPSPDKTITFRDLGRPENSLVGTGYQSYLDEEDFGYPWVAYASSTSWYFDCTGLQPGDAINNVVGDEWDAMLNNGFTPPGIEVMAQGNMSDPHGNSLLHQATIYTAPSGAKVFAAGSILFSWGLIDHSYANQAFQPAYQSNAADPRLEQLMANIIDRFSGYWNGQPRTCSGQTFYKVGPRPTRTPMPTIPAATPIATFTSTPPRSATATATRQATTTTTATATPTPAPSCSMTYVSLDVPKPVPDQGMITSTLRISDVGTIADIAIANLSLQHTYASDLSVYVTSPQGTRIALFTNVCGSGVWTAANTGFTVGRQGSSRMGTVCPPGQGTYLPKDTSLDPLVGQQASGTWTLEVQDGGPYDVGSLLAWSLWISYSLPCPIGTPMPSATPTNTAILSSTPPPTNTRTTTSTTSPTGTATPSHTSTSTFTNTPAPTITRTATASGPTGTPTRTPTMTRTSTRTQTATIIRTPSRTSTPTRTPTGSVSTPTSTPVCSMTYSSTDVPKAVPDQGVTTSALTIADVGTIADIQVANLSLQHTYASDLSVYITSPQGTRIALFTNVCGSGVWTAANTGFTVGRQGSSRMGTVCPPGQGTYLPKDTSLDPLVGQQASGLWTLEVQDGGPYDVGSLLAWSLVITYAGPTCPIHGFWEGTATAAVPSPTATSGLLNVDFADVPAGETFYPYVQWMASRGFVTGYPCGVAGEPCPGTYFRPNANVTRAQLLKMVVNSVRWDAVNPKDATFADVPRSSTFYTIIETAYSKGIVGGYACGGSGEPCDALNRPYFRPNSNITRGQLSKVIALTNGYALPEPADPTFTDVPASHTFYSYIQAMYTNGIINGYACGGPGEPCDTLNRPYFRPSNTATRGQATKLLAANRVTAALP